MIEFGNFVGIFSLISVLFLKFLILRLVLKLFWGELVIFEFDWYFIFIYILFLYFLICVGLGFYLVLFEFYFGYG
ncbi:hypothetical protein A33I_20955 [Alkalihalophilus marmarensis DSM 21297]|uniref:Uncharacterized protein n=1 Tax=Alkalihalophilus marmarensis DSM 21297 TaxID=1188261 RepID=U6SKF0_9BACI|nr:hypothetical protein A33I_20955 [Alkalihalophilus marmarensis DSM 21297]